MKFTREQLLAQSTDRHLAVVANAGSGKTAVLVNRYLSLLLGGVDVREIVAITFTKKAAAEMQKRVAEKLEAILADPEQQERWGEVKRIRERLNSARISTIHSFCARLLRDFPIEADVNPNFTELTEYEAFVLKQRAVTEALEDRLQTESEHRPATLHLVRTFSRKTVEEYLLSLLSSAEHLQIIRTLYTTHDDKQILTRCRETFGRFVYNQVHLAAEFFHQLFELLNPDDFKTAKKTLEQILEAQSAFGILEEELSRFPAVPSWDNIERLLALTNSIQEVVCTKSKGYELKSAIAKKIDNQAVVFSINTHLPPALLPLTGVEEICRNHELDREVLALGRTLVAIADDALQTIEREKERVGALDFDDLQLKAALLLENPEVATKIERRFRYVMIDEFQDTNELQYSIARRIVHALQHAEDDDADVNGGINIFIVGDPKQSIYGFRGADVRVFDRAQQHIQLVNRRVLPTFDNSTGYEVSEYFGNVRLSASFRLLPVVAAFVNRVCGSTMGTSGSAFDVAYEALVCGRQSDIPDAGNGSITMLIAQKRRSGFNQQDEEEEETEEPGELLSEAELLAQHLKTMVASETPASVWERSKGAPGETPRPARWGDIAVLARSRSGFDALAAAMRRNDIPFVINSGTGYYERQEILDMRSFLLFLQNSNDDIALAAILRAPFFGVDDTELYNISVCTGGSLWERVQDYHKTYCNSGCSRAFLRAWTILTELLPLAPRLTIPSLLRLILSRTAWRGMIAGDERYEQMQANVEKLLSLAREFEGKGFRNLFDFAEELQSLALHSDSEGEAEVTIGKDAVQIMTIHASKGLEFPIVALYQSASVNNRTDAFQADTDFGACFRLPVAGNDGLPQDIVTPLYRLAVQKASEREQAERKRVLYVALTRAENHLVITGTVTVNSSGEVNGVDGFLRNIAEALELPSTDLRFNRTTEFNDPLVLLHNNERIDHKLAYNVSVRTTIPGDVVFVESDTESNRTWEQPPLLIDEPPVSIEGDMYSASQLQLFISNPYEYELVYRLGLPPSEENTDYDRSRLMPEETPDVTGTLPGTIIHAVLATLPSWYQADGTVDTLAHETLISRTLLEHDLPATHPAAERIRRETLAVARHPFLAEKAAFLDGAKFEYPFHLYAGRDYLLGSVDVLIPDANGALEIWDWKTNIVTSAFDMYRLFERYRLQLEVYAWFLARLRPEQQRITARLLFTRLADKANTAEGWIQTLHVERSELPRIEAKIHSIMDEIRRVSYGNSLAER